ncbi:aldo/keto reductase [Treponema pectinovorum]|uniref:aldo/keto reductase n=1 Tax=Treponema pectinovorum TaxID=164 RepID=UPI0011CA4CF0|nr:aldo/keto reductase [Treponema pectinovorum]
MNFKKLTDCYELSNGVKIPCLGLGTWQSANGKESYDSVYAALKNGYRHIDTATAYGNEESIGNAVCDFIKNTGTPRQDIFITTKLWNDDHGYQTTKSALELSLKKLKTDYIDLYLIHWPNPLKFRDCWAEKNAESWQAMEELYKEGKIRAIGLSNFCERHIKPLLKMASIKPMVNQIKVCPGQIQQELSNYSRNLGMLIESYSPLGRGEIFKNDEMALLAKKYSRTVAQVCLRWNLQCGNLPIPKSTKEERLIENSQIFDFELEQEDIQKIANLSGLETQLARNPDEAPF